MKPSLVLISAVLQSCCSVEALQKYKLPWWHPEIQYIADELIPAPPNHPPLDDDPAFQEFVRANTGRSHQFFDGPDGYLLEPWALSGSHPNCDRYFELEEVPYDDFPTVYFDHPDIEEAYTSGRPLPEGHPSVHAMFRHLLPSGHPNLDDLFSDEVRRELPEWHPDLSLMLNFEDLPKGMPSVPVYFDHPSITDSYEQGRPMPKGHPSVTEMLHEYLPPGHPLNLDEMMFDPARYPLPLGHPDLSSFVSIRDLPNGPSIPVYFEHPNIAESYEQGRPMPAGHPSVADLLLEYLPPGHPLNLDEMMENPDDFPLPFGHPDLSAFLSVEALPKGLPSVPVYFEHPNIADSYEQGRPMPAGHPSVADLLLEYLPPGHPLNLDEMMLIPSEYPLPLGHPDLSTFLSVEALPKGLPSLPVYFEHPDITDSYEQGRPMPTSHPSVADLLLEYLPPGHPLNLDEMMLNPSEYPLPLGHPDLSSFISVQESPFVSNLGQPSADGLSSADVGSQSSSDQPNPTVLALSVFDGHPRIESGEFLPVKHHPPIHHLFADLLPPSHPNIDDLLEEGFTLPSWHPAISSTITQRDLSLSPGALLCYTFSALFVVAVFLRHGRRWKNSKRTEKVVLDDRSLGDTLDVGTIGTVEETCECPEDKAISIDGDVEVDLAASLNLVRGLPRLDRRHYTAMQLHKSHHDDHLCSQAEPVHSSIIAYQEKRQHSAWVTACHKRMIGTHESKWDFLVCLLYVAGNIAVLMASPYDFNVGFGSLAAANILFVVLTATKNSALTWFLGIPFHQILVFHRFIGRLMVLAAFIHSAFSFDRLLELLPYRTYTTGFIALLCCLVLGVFSLNWIRRRLFTAFYWSHIAFIGLFVCVFMHASGARPFIIASVVIYGIDRMLHVVWTQLPRKTTTIKKVGQRETAFVRFDKPRLIRLLGRYRVGQYVFVNFPALSLTEWHPFSVASGPREAFIDLYIRDLGDHTKRVVDFAEKCASKNKQALVRVDGPYGSLPFNCRRYGALVLVGAGIGITPLIGVVKDVYERGEEGQHTTIAHCIKEVRLIWIMPYQSEMELFLDQLLAYRERSSHDPLLPLLDIDIYITREEPTSGTTGASLHHSRPAFPTVMENCATRCKQDGASSILVYACGPGAMINQLWDASMKENSKHLRVDFYHESFEF